MNADGIRFLINVCVVALAVSTVRNIQKGNTLRAKCTGVAFFLFTVASLATTF